MNITYFLGAGASANAIPTVEGLNEAFGIIANLIRVVVPDVSEFTISRKIIDAHLTTAQRASGIYGTVDTYAKKLSLTNDKDLYKLKAALSIFFTIWQEIDKESIFGDKTIYKNIDHRYFGLLANYITKRNDGMLEIPPNIKFISWNYDCQLEMAISNLVNKDVNEVLDTYNIYPFCANKPGISPTIVHLNGIAGIHKERDSEKIISFLGKKSWDKADKIQKLLPLIAKAENEELGHSDFFSYAWETDKISTQAVNIAKDIIEKTDILIIIGYSFPTFNDSIDKVLMEKLVSENRFLKVYYQDPSASKELLTSRFGISEDEIVLVKEKSQFILPLESKSYGSKLDIH